MRRALADQTLAGDSEDLQSQIEVRPGSAGKAGQLEIVHPGQEGPFVAGGKRYFGYTSRAGVEYQRKAGPRDVDADLLPSQQFQAKERFAPIRASGNVVV